MGERKATKVKNKQTVLSVSKTPKVGGIRGVWTCAALPITIFFRMEIDDWRSRIDELTDTVIALLNKRAVYATEIGKLKKQKGLPVLDTAREEAVLAAVAEKAEKAGGPLSGDSVRRIFKVIMEETRKVEE